MINKKSIVLGLVMYVAASAAAHAVCPPGQVEINGQCYPTENGGTGSQPGIGNVPGGGGIAGGGSQPNDPSVSGSDPTSGGNEDPGTPMIGPMPTYPTNECDVVEAKPLYVERCFNFPVRGGGTQQECAKQELAYTPAYICRQHEGMI